MTPEFSRPERVDAVGERERAVSIEADPAERAALAERFDTLNRQPRNARLCARLAEPIQTLLHPIQKPIGRGSVQKIVSNVGNESSRWQRRARL